MPTRPPFLVDSAGPEKCWICRKRPASPALFWEGAGVCRECYSEARAAGAKKPRRPAPVKAASPAVTAIVLIVILVPILMAILTSKGFGGNDVADLFIWCIGIAIGAAIVIWIISAGVRMGLQSSRQDTPIAARTSQPPPSAFHVIPAAMPVPSSPGRFKVTGVDRETRMDCIQFYEALGPDNANVKAELDGIVVTRVESAQGTRRGSERVRRITIPSVA
jgi:hypothetical protein